MRTALMCALVFLGLNGHRLEADPEAVDRLVDGVASGDVDKAEVAVFLREYATPRQGPGTERSQANTGPRGVPKLSPWKSVKKSMG